MIKGAIFDVDGTLLDSMVIWETIAERYLLSLGKEPRENLKETFWSMSLPEAARYYQTEYGVALSVEEILDGINGIVAQFYREDAQVKEGIPALLEGLRERGVRMSIATATDRSFVEPALIHCGIREYFDDIFTCTSVGHSKREPIIYRRALACIRTEKQDTAVFEDALYALRTAKNDGFLTVAVYDQYEKQQAELTALADFCIGSFLHLDAFWEFASRRGGRS